MARELVLMYVTEYYIFDNIRKNKNSLCMEKGYHAMCLCKIPDIGHVK